MTKEELSDKLDEAFNLVESVKLEIQSDPRLAESTKHLAVVCNKLAQVSVNLQK